MYERGVMLREDAVPLKKAANLFYKDCIKMLFEFDTFLKTWKGNTWFTLAIIVNRYKYF